MVDSITEDTQKRITDLTNQIMLKHPSLDWAEARVKSTVATVIKNGLYLLTDGLIRVSGDFIKQLVTLSDDKYNAMMQGWVDNGVIGRGENYGSIEIFTFTLAQLNTPETLLVIPTQISTSFIEQVCEDALDLTSKHPNLTWDEAVIKCALRLKFAPFIKDNHTMCVGFDLELTDALFGCPSQSILDRLIEQGKITINGDGSGLTMTVAELNKNY